MQASTPAANFRGAKKRLLFIRSGVEFLGPSQANVWTCQTADQSIVMWMTSYQNNPGPMLLLLLHHLHCSAFTMEAKLFLAVQ